MSKLYKYLPFVIGATLFSIAAVVLHDTLKSIDPDDLAMRLSVIPAWKLAASVALMIVSYLLLTLYDLLALKYVRSGLKWKQIAAPAFSAFAVGHNIGASALSGGAIRYRSYSSAGLTAEPIAKVIVFIGVTFALGMSLLLGLSLVLEPISMLAPFHTPRALLRIIGVLFLLVPTIYLIWSGIVKRPIAIRNWKYDCPSLKIACSQLLLSVVDILVVAGVFYLLLPDHPGLSYLSFLGVYILALTAGILSGIPGGVGIFEGTLILLLPNIPAPQLLVGMVAFRTIYYVLPLAFAALILAIQEVALRKHQLSAIRERALLLTKAAPQVFSSLMFLAGAVLMVKGSIPVLATAPRLLPDFLIDVSHIAGSITGLLILILSQGLFRRLRGAYVLSMWLLGAAVVMSLIKSHSQLEVFLLVALMVVLWAGRFEFYRSQSIFGQRIGIGWLLCIVAVVGSTVWLGFFFNQQVQYNNELWWTFALDQSAPRVLRASLVLTLILAILILRRLLRASRIIQESATEGEIQRARTILATSKRAEASLALTGDKLFLFSSKNDAFIMYQISGGSAIALGDPIGNPAAFSTLCWEYKDLCNRLDLICAFYKVCDEYLSIYIDLGLAFSKLGESANVPLGAFSLEGGRRADLRQACNKADREGAKFEIVSADKVGALLGELKGVSDAWLVDKDTAEKGFSVGSFDPEYLKNFDFAIVQINNKIVAFANILKSADGVELSVDLMRYTDAAPKGTMDYLFAQMMLWGRDNGFKYFTLGMAPLSGLDNRPLAPAWHKIGNFIFRHGDNFYSFDGLRKYKEKYDPEWEPRYLATPGGFFILPKVLFDSASLIAGSARELFLK